MKIKKLIILGIICLAANFAAGGLYEEEQARRKFWEDKIEKVKQREVEENNARIQNFQRSDGGGGRVLCLIAGVIIIVTAISLAKK